MSFVTVIFEKRVLYTSKKYPILQNETGQRSRAFKRKALAKRKRDELPFLEIHLNKKLLSFANKSLIKRSLNSLIFEALIMDFFKNKACFWFNPDNFNNNS